MHYFIKPAKLFSWFLYSLAVLIGRNELLSENDPTLKGTKTAVELDRFKRRLIHSVVRLLLRDKKPEREVWEILKRDTGCNCKILWSRMRALTLKKLEGHLLAEDHVDRVPLRARMNLTDWMMVDLVLVHQDLDFIGQELNVPENFSALDELFKLVNMFGIEGLKGEALAEAWSSATLHYNKNGHHCSPMLLQKRWYQLKAVTRNKFYNFWYAYKGCIKRLHVADPYKPTPLEHAIARRYKSLITSPHLSWEELIEQRLVSLPEEFERTMMERAGFPMHLRRQSCDDASDIELVEPKIDTIDLRQESDEPQGESKNDENLPQIVRVKQEPPDPDLDPEPLVEIPKKSIYEEVLESTMKENLVLDEMLTNGYFETCNDNSDEVEAVDLEDKQEMMMPQITCVFSNVSEGNLDMYSGIDKNTLPQDDEIDKDGAKLDDAATVITEGDVDPVTVDNQTPTVVVDGQVESVEEETGVIQLDGVDKDSNVDDVTNKVDDLTNTADDIIDKVDDVTDAVKIDSKTVTVQAESHTVEGDNLTDTVEVHDLTNTPRDDDETNATILVDEENTQNKNDKVFDKQADVVAPVKIDIEVINKNPMLKALLDQTENVEKDVEVIEDKESMKPVVITDSEDEPHSDPIEKPMDENKMEITVDTTTEVTENDEAMNEKVDSKANVKVEALKFSFGELPQELSFVDDGIELADDGIAFDDYDDYVEIKIEPETEEPKIDPKLLMVPVVYVKRLDDLKIFRNKPFDHIRHKNIIDAVIINSLPIKQENTCKQEPQDIIEDTPITPADDNDESMSTDEDSNDSVIPEKVKVKPTSYLLQKPRSRSYNPIQLCKNPDFNTRLKRLNVGFFKSHRNRALIKHCKPLTIDVSKAFETRLINGTLYLKPESTDDKIEIEITDNSEIVQNATVVPSAMIAQSLIDNTKTSDIIPLIPRNLEPVPKPVEHERNTRINLPDISEIRRINQRLLTAEISPIQIQNKTFHAPVTLISNEPSQSPGVPSTPTPDVTVVHTAASDNSSGHVVNSLPESSTRGQTGFSRGRGRWSYNARRMVHQKSKQRPFKSYTAISWLSKSNDPNILSKEQDCTLLTLDTLNKMLNILGDKDLPNGTQKKQKGSTDKEKKKQDPSSSQVKIDKGNQMANIETDNKIETGVCKPRINVKAAVNGPSIYKPRKKQQTQTMTDATDEQAQPKKRLYCCWSRQRMLQLLFSKKRLPEHECRDGDCVCCCRQLLWSYIAQDRKIKLAQKRQNNAMTECAEAASTCANLNKDASCNADKLVGPAVTKVTATQITPPLATVTINSGAQNEIRPHVSTMGVGSVVTATTAVTTPPLVQNVSAIANPTITLPLVDTLGQPMIQAQPLSTSDLNLTKSERLKTYTNSFVKKPNQSTQTKSGKPFKPPKFLKEKLIFLNSKHIAEKPSRNPIYLGKNKVLMTTVKFPWNLKLFEEAKQALASTLKLPAGVSLVCLPDGTISYSIDNVHVKALDLALMPSIIATVQMHMNNALQKSQSQSKQNVKPTVNSNDVIDLVDDEDEAHNKTEKHLDTNNSNSTNETGNVMNSIETTCIQDNTQVLSQDKMLVSEAQLVQTDLSRTNESQSPEVTIEMKSTQSDPPNLASTESQLQPTLISTEDQIKLVPTNQAESIEAVKELPTEPGQPKEIKDKSEQELLVEQGTEQAKPGPSSQGESLTVTQEFQLPTVPGPPNQTQVHESIPSEVQSQPDLLIQKPPTENTVDPEQSTHQPKKTKNILSDLMEMSGIFDDDVAPASEETLPTPAQPETFSIPAQPETFPIPAQPETFPIPAQQETLFTPVSGPAPAPLSILSQMVASVAQPVVQPAAKLQGTILGPIPNNYLSCQPLIKTPLGDLSPITSLYELKYACANKGIFFKLDFETGYLVPINVCLKAPVKQHPKVITEKAVIDLTSEGKSDQPQPNHKKNIALLSPIRGSLTPVTVTSARSEVGANPVRPCSLLKVPNSGIPIPSILRRLNADNKCQENINTWIKARGRKAHKQKRKQQLQQVDLNDSEEYIVPPSSEKATKRHKSTDTQEPTASTSRVQEEEDVTTVYDSSDDEPLSKVAKLKRQEENKRTTRIVIDFPEMEEDEQLDDNLDTHEDIPELDQSHSSDDNEENCILGV